MREPIESANTYELIAEQLLAEIGTRSAPGRHAADRARADRIFKVGRSSVREGLRMLESKGVISRSATGPSSSPSCAARSTARSRSCSRSTRPT